MTLPRVLWPIARPNVGWVSLAAAVGLTLVGAAAISLVEPATARRQLMFLPVALVAMLVTALPHHRRLVDYSYILLAITLAMLVVLLLPFMPESIVPVRNNARRWFNLQLAGLSFQPSELTKITYVLALACYLRYRHNYRALRGLLPPLLLTFLPMGLILVEPDLGTAMLFLPALFAMLIAAGARLKHIIAIVLIGICLMPAMYPLLKPHQKARIVAVVSQVQGDTRHRDDIGFQGFKAQTLVGAGKLTGHDADFAQDLVRFNALPEAHNDMIFAVITTRWGLLGAAGLLGLYLVLVLSGLLAAAVNRDPFARLIGVGVVTFLFTQMFVNIGMTVGVLPITGMTLPFVSYGGSSLVANFMMIGLLLNIAARRPLIIGQPAFEFDRPRDEPVHRSPQPMTS